MSKHALESRIFQDEGGITEGGKGLWAGYILRGGLFLGLLHWGRAFRIDLAALGQTQTRMFNPVAGWA